MAVLRTNPKRVNKEMLYKALTDPAFRKLLAESPTRALRVRRLNKLQLHEIKLVLASLKGIEAQMNALADQLLCACAVTV